MSTYPCYIPPQTLACTFDALTSSLGIFYETLMHHATRSGSPHNALHSPNIYIYNICRQYLRLHWLCRQYLRLWSHHLCSLLQLCMHCCHRMVKYSNLGSGQFTSSMSRQYYLIEDMQYYLLLNLCNPWHIWFYAVMWVITNMWHLCTWNGDKTSLSSDYM